MIQRLQSVLLFFAAVLMLVALFVPVWVFPSGQSSEQVFGAYTVVNQSEEKVETVRFFDHPEVAHKVLHSAFVVLDVLSVVFLIYIIFGYNNRKRQMQQSLYAMLLLAVSVLMLVLYTMKEPEYLLGGEGQGQVQWGFALPIVAIGLTWYAARLIKKDDDLVRSSDRLR